MKIRSLYLAFVILALGYASPLRAQAALSPPAAADDTTPVRGAAAVRGVTAALGWVPGAYVGGYVAHHTLSFGPCGCDDPGLSEILAGVVVGGAIGAGLGAALPKLNSHCSFAQRFGRGLLGSAVGTIIGIIPITAGSQAITIPVFSIVGSAIAEHGC